MTPIDIIDKYYRKDDDSYKILISHSFAVADKALSIARLHPEMKLDGLFIYEAAILHDIGIFKTNAPDIYCFGEFPYICHGYLGSEILQAENMPAHALVCERHTGTGLSEEYIIARKLPIPRRNMVPVSLEEQIICFADKFFSKTHLDREKTVDNVRKDLARYGEDSVDRFNEWCELFIA
jgi:uncharacterized protein